MVKRKNKSGDDAMDVDYPKRRDNADDDSGSDSVRTEEAFASI